MAKTAFGSQLLLYPLPAFLIGAEVEGRPNFMTAAWCGVVNSDPPMVSVAIRPARHTFKGIKANQTFSVNVPSADMVKETDYCGIVSGAVEDKVSACNFSVFYGRLKNAPMLESCPVNLECRVAHELALGSHSLFVGRIEESFVSDQCLTDNEPDIKKIRPIIFGRGNKKAYYDLGPLLAPAYRAGLEIKNR
jgi:flavin reductase (DIM6/NTAB) family NADH-FMN oxidoreductase RutF